MNTLPTRDPDFYLFGDKIPGWQEEDHFVFVQLVDSEIGGEFILFAEDGQWDGNEMHAQILRTEFLKALIKKFGR